MADSKLSAPNSLGSITRASSPTFPSMSRFINKTVVGLSLMHLAVTFPLLSTIRRFLRGYVPSKIPQLSISNHVNRNSTSSTILETWSVPKAQIQLPFILTFLAGNRPKYHFWQSRNRRRRQRPQPVRLPVLVFGLDSYGPRLARHRRMERPSAIRYEHAWKDTSH